MTSKLDNKKSYTELFKGFIRVSIDKSNNAAIRGHPSTQESSYYRKGIPERMCSVIGLPIHSLTHFDIVHASLDDINNYFQPQIFERIAIINFCYKREILKEYLFKESDSLYGDTEYPFLDMGRFKSDSEEEQYTTLNNILNNLQINENDLLKGLKGYNLKDLNGIILRTDWSDFRYGKSELNNPFFEMFHAFLIHPYLNLSTIKFIKSQNPNIKLIGSDTPALVNPASFVDPSHTFPIIRKVYYKLYNEGIISKNIDLAEAFIENKPRYFIKNIGKLSYVQEESEIITIGSVILIPIPLLFEQTGMVCELYFKKESGSESLEFRD